MKSALIIILFLLTFYSCNVIKIFRSTENIKELPSEPKKEPRTMIASGKVIEFRNGVTQEILFLGKENLPRESTFIKIYQEKNDEFKEANLTFIGFEEGEKFKIITSYPTPPLIIINGKFQEDLKLLKDLDPETIESINIIKGDNAIKKFGEQGANGAIEIISRETEF
tara:strand:+ start:1756 stop:2259 length:504 start_codon:yes stop_codon:yes gene_type:complete